MRHKKDRFIPKSLDDQFLEYVQADVCINRAQGIIEEINVPEMTNIRRKAFVKLINTI